MILRFSSRIGQFRLNVEPSTDISTLLPQIVEKLTPDTLSASVAISPQRGGQSRLLESLKGVTLQKLGLANGAQIFVEFSEGQAPTNGQPPAPLNAHRLNGKEVTAQDTTTIAIPNLTAQTRVDNPWDTVKQLPLDDVLDKENGKIKRPRDTRMCRHGANGMCDHCQPIEPYDAGYLAEKKIKHLSYHAYLRKMNQGKNKYESGSSWMPPLTEPYYRVNPNCPSGHKPFPAGICTKCQPSAITLQPQPYRMVDHVEFSSPAIINKILDFWRNSAAQRIGFMYGRYEPYAEIPLGTKAVIEAIYEPPQVDELDGVTLNDWTNENEIDQVASLCGLQRVGVIFTDLLDSGKGDGTVACKRHADSYFMSSLEIMFASRYQAKYPRPSRWSETGSFGSNFVTCIITGDDEDQIAIQAYQASDSAVEMTRADIIEPSADPTVMLVRDEDEENELGRTRYIPEVFYRRINEYGANVQENAKPSFPVEYLLVTLTHGFPLQPNPLFTSEEGFIVENREMIGQSQEHRALKTFLSKVARLDTDNGVQKMSDFHALCFVHTMGVLSEDEFRLLCQVATQKDTSLGAALQQTPGWKSLLTIVELSGDRRPKRRNEWSANGGASGDGSDGEQLAKRVKNIGLNGSR
ncbi:nuclear protein localization protein 4 [Aureobasidium subglaciale]|nr:nuclear protein localization protein 4 [Aureobasidium subglaciale]KAI5224556.1 nuclear protein localization protein 4 [Aureobasidium subglaciale]KAI5227773.1 nuclear protein localization protein 4 [Aureobasidium subglaciale]KAI5263247.1 nuclear protein localization protein 4 [Aureobasidium subglaciale]